MERTVNKVELNGFLGTDPVIFNTGNGGKVARLRIATTESYKTREGDWVNNTSWHNVVMFGKQAEAADKDLKKSMRIALTGRLVYRRYTDKDGNEKFVTEISSNNFEIVKLDEKSFA
jgi:single-strand DNA-binding protein